ncbi:MAG: peptidoglycan-binding protein [Alphaproteobacteria bacterium]
MRRVFLALAATGALSAPAAAGDAPTAMQQVQIIQSALDVLGHDPGPIDGRWGAQTAAAVAAFTRAEAYDGPSDGPNDTLAEALLSLVGPAAEARFGTDPTGTWDLDFAAMSAEERQQLMEVYGLDSLESCASLFAIYFSGGIVYRQWDTGSPVVMEVAEGRMLSLDPGSEFEPFAFVFVDELTMHREVEGFTEVWARCDQLGGAPL